MALLRAGLLVEKGWGKEGRESQCFPCTWGHHNTVVVLEAIVCFHFLLLLVILLLFVLLLLIDQLGCNTRCVCVDEKFRVFINTPMLLQSRRSVCKPGCLLTACSELVIANTQFCLKKMKQSQSDCKAEPLSNTERQSRRTGPPWPVW